MENKEKVEWVIFLSFDRESPFYCRIAILKKEKKCSKKKNKKRKRGTFCVILLWVFSFYKLLCNLTFLMANKEEHFEDSNSIGGDTFGAVKQRFKDRSKVRPSSDYI